MQRTMRAHKQRGCHAPHNISLESCTSGRRSGWAVRRFDSLVLNEVPDVVLCLCAQGEGKFLRIAPQRYKSKKPSAKRRFFSLHRQQGHRQRYLRNMDMFTSSASPGRSSPRQSCSLIDICTCRRSHRTAVRYRAARPPPPCCGEIRILPSDSA